MGRVCGRKHFIRTLTGRFPEVAARIDECSRGLLHCEMGAFAAATNEAIHRGDVTTVRAHFEYAQELLRHAGPALANAIAVSHVESIDFGPSADWIQPRALLPPLLAQELQELEDYLERLFSNDPPPTRPPRRKPGAG